MPDKSNPYKAALEKAFDLGNQFLDGLDQHPVGTTSSYEELKALWDWTLPVKGMEPDQVIEQMNNATLPGLNLNQSGRFFAWVIGGSHPSAIAADWLTSVWDQNAGLYACTPSSGIVEEIAGRWLKKLLHLPDQATFSFVTGCQMAHFTCLASARNHLMRLQGWDFEAGGFYGAPPIRIICSEQKHSTISRVLRMLGFGTDMLIQLPTDDKGRMILAAFEAEMKRQPEVPALVLLQAGDIHTGAYDDFASIIPLAHAYDAWVHIDGAFGLWAAASSKYQHLMVGADLADSWATDGHKWLNVPYDSGYAFTVHPEAHFRSFTVQAGYLVNADHARDEMNYTPEFSRRARGFPTYAAIKELGAEGIEHLVDRCCRHAFEIVEQAGRLPYTEVVALPIINQGLLRFKDPHHQADESAHDRFTDQVIKAINDSGEAFFQGTTYKGNRCMRVSVSGWRTGENDVSRTIQAIAKAVEIAVERN